MIGLEHISQSYFFICIITYFYFFYYKYLVRATVFGYVRRKVASEANTFFVFILFSL